MGRYTDGTKSDIPNSSGEVWIRHPPWFHVAVGYDLKLPAHYDLWVTPKGYYGHQFMTRSTHFYSRLVTNGANFAVHQRKDSKRLGAPQNMKEDDDLEGQAMQLDDGTVVSVMGGNDGVRVLYFEVKDGKFVGQRFDLGTFAAALHEA